MKNVSTTTGITIFTMKEEATLQIHVAPAMITTSHMFIKTILTKVIQINGVNTIWQMGFLKIILLNNKKRKDHSKLSSDDNNPLDYQPH